MSTRIFGVSVGTILLIVAVVVVVRMWGSRIPGVSAISSAS